MAQIHSEASRKLGANIAALRHRVSFSASRLAECADLDLSHLQRLERGTGIPTLYTIVQIAVALEVEPGELLDGIEARDLPVGREPYGYTQHEERRRRARSGYDPRD
ncbi:MAG: helix-turn-helix transcriptional regulator [Microbacterium sp.]